MDAVPARVDFPAQEAETLEHWAKTDAFQESLRRSKGKKPFAFFDGPPFATGLPHFGHILAGTIKDTVTRYAHQTGHHVERRFGWDTHGLPVEFEIDKALGISGAGDVLKMGIDKYNAECRSIVMRYSSEWRTIITRLGRWIDFDNDYKTLDPTYMESVWWVFAQLHKKGLVYQGFKVMPYSIGCSTPLSNFEANQNYKDVSDPSIMITMPLVGDKDGAAIIIWTTTPWTLPSNLAVCLHPDLDYVRVRSTVDGKVYIVAEARASHVFPPPKKGKGKGKGADADADAAPASYEILAKYKGSELKGLEYTPPMPELFDAEWRPRGAFRILNDKYVTADGGTGCVHCAPAFGEDDYRVCLEAKIIAKGPDILCPVDGDGKFTDEVPPYAGIMVKDADKPILAALKASGRLFSSSSFVHSYPFCWRSDTPLIYKAVPSWFIKVEGMRDQLLENNARTMWVPEFVQEKRFAGWLRDARDWAVSRNRFWGTPLPMWVSEDLSEIVCVSSIDELEQLSGVRVTDLHRESIDHITIPSREGKGVLRRTPEVFDCWFESGSMPYAQVHYPFAFTDADGKVDEARFLESFPADFIAEGVDQTRGWFYTLLVLGTALFGTAPFKNLIANGLVLAEDGKKMSKRLKNYPDPMLVVDQYGADALRMYLINSPVVRAMNLCFKADGVKDCLKDVILPWQNAYRFFVTSAALWRSRHDGAPFQPDTASLDATTNVMDRWVLAATQSLIGFVRGEMAGYRLYTVIPALVKHIERLTNWYIRLNRSRLKGQAAETGDGGDGGDGDGDGDGDGGDGSNSSNEADTAAALNTLYSVLMTMCVTMAPFTPYIVEAHYQNLSKLLPEDKREPSVHFLPYPEVNEALLDPVIERNVGHLIDIVELGRTARDHGNIPIRTPVRGIVIIAGSSEALEDLGPNGTYQSEIMTYVRGELNVRDVEVVKSLPGIIHSLHLDGRVVGKRVGSAFKAMMAEAAQLPSDEVSKFKNGGELTLAGEKVFLEECSFRVRYEDPEVTAANAAAAAAAAAAGGAADAAAAAEEEDGKKKGKKAKGGKKGGKGAGADADADAPAGRYQAASRDSTVVLLDTTADSELMLEGLARSVSNRIQRLRKKAALNPTEPCEIFYTILKAAPDSLLPAVLGEKADTVAQLCKRPVLPSSSRPRGALSMAADNNVDIDGDVIAIDIARPSFAVALPDRARAEFAELVLNSLDRPGVLARAEAAGGEIPLNLEGERVTLKHGVDVFDSATMRASKC